MHTLLINILAKIGVWCCQKSIHMADSGHIDFEVAVPHKQPIIVYLTQKPKRKNLSLLFIVATCIVSGVAVWAALTLSLSIERSCDKITQELQREHKEDSNFNFRNLQTALFNR